MLTIHLPDREYWDEGKEEFINIPGKTVVMEHSLVSLSKWEMKWKKPFLTPEQKTLPELLSYYHCMVITQNVGIEEISSITPEIARKIEKYIDDPMSATEFKPAKKKAGRKPPPITSERIYSWMVSNQIPVDFQKWHLNRLLTLIRLCSEANTPPDNKKMTGREISEHNRSLNMMNRAKYRSKG